MAKELTITIRRAGLEKAAQGDTTDLLALAKAAVPEAEFLTGNVRYSISVSIPDDKEQTLRDALTETCYVEERAFLSFPKGPLDLL